MGGKYRVTGTTFPRMRRPRHRRAVLAAVGATAAVSLVGWGTVQAVDIFTGGGGPAARAAVGDKNCTARQATASPASPAPVALPEPGEITVNVYNATTESGLAKKTAKALEKRGFTIGEIDNAPAEYDKKVKDTALLLSGPGAGKAPEVLGAHVTDARTEQARDGDRDSGDGGGDGAKKQPAEGNAKGDKSGTPDETGDAGDAGKAKGSKAEIDFIIGEAFTGLAPESKATKTVAALAEPSPRPSSRC
ncbi:LytR C-terminal domain-containing protein [Streptomyces sp. PLAI1-29]|uniref:LytR C-terminal domain-containing protein n=2 Tax=Streptomyces zingiberis TaxID=2053010 RepID=A0ABX1BN64_9ACTN|nr:LytR C-terminal domain-containing protein [Streptomyces zingiberis]